MPPAPLTAIGFDADDTLWQNEHFYKLTQARFAALLAPFRAMIDAQVSRELDRRGRAKG